MSNQDYVIIHFENVFGKCIKIPDAFENFQFLTLHLARHYIALLYSFEHQVKWIPLQDI